jgi:hypothetical protein
MDTKELKNRLEQYKDMDKALQMEIALSELIIKQSALETLLIKNNIINADEYAVLLKDLSEQVTKNIMEMSKLYSEGKKEN